MRRFFHADFLRRLIAGGSAALVFALSVFAASPVAHDWLHDRSTAAADDACAVVLFASGVAIPLDAPVAPTPLAELRAQPAAVAAEIFLTSPRYLRQPERGPPTSLTV